MLIVIYPSDEYGIYCNQTNSLNVIFRHQQVRCFIHVHNNHIHALISAILFHFVAKIYCYFSAVLLH